VKPAQWISGALLVGALAVAAAACNSITGLNDYEKVDCVGACGDAGLDGSPETAPDVIDDVRQDGDSSSGDWDADAFLEAGTDADADVDAPDDAPNDVNFDAGEVGSIARTSRWARWQMPHADLPAPDSGDPPGPTPSEGYEDVGSDYFRDIVTRVLWTHTYAQQLTFADAVGYCDSLSTPTLKMRLPTRIELVSLLEPTLPPPCSALTEVKPGEYWTLSDAPNGDQTGAIKYWVVDFYSGAVHTVLDDSIKEAYVRCVVESEP
jgi:Protein of unknown function (DUF1566)